jgi:hypothetical protein
MIKLVVALVTLSLATLAQPPTPPPAPTTTTPTLPAEVVFASGSYTDKPGEKFAGTISFATRLPTPASSYSYTSWDVGFTKVNSKVTFSNSTRTGGALELPQVSLGAFHVFILGTAGVTTINASALASGSFGVLLAYQIPKTPWGFWGDFQDSNTTGKTVRLGVLFAWGR